MAVPSASLLPQARMAGRARKARENLLECQRAEFQKLWPCRVSLSTLRATPFPMRLAGHRAAKGAAPEIQEVIEMEKLQEKAIAAAARFCERKGLRIIETGWKSPMGGTADIIADDGGTICFVDVAAREASERGFEDRHMPRHDWEKLAMSWLMGSDIEGDAGVRFDACEILVSGTKAILKYHESALSEG